MARGRRWQSGVSRLAGDQVHIDTQQGRRRVEAAFHRGGEDDVAVAGEGQPAVLGQLLLQLPRRPAGVAEGDQVFLRPLVSRDGAKDVAVVAVASGGLPRNSRLSGIMTKTQMIPMPM